MDTTVSIVTSRMLSEKIGRDLELTMDTEVSETGLPNSNVANIQIT